MRLLVRAVVVAAALLLPHAANADLLVSITEPSIEFGPEGASLNHSAFENIFIDGIFQETSWLSSFSGDVSFETGALQSLTVDDSDPDAGSSLYVFGPGTFTLTANWQDQIGNLVQGQDVAPLLSLVIDVRCEQELSAQSCGDSFGDSLGDAFVSIGPGHFDHNLASILRLKKQGGAFDFDIALDGITGDPTDPFRLAGSAAGGEDIEIPVAVPEPSILSLLLLAPVFGLRFRR